MRSISLRAGLDSHRSILALALSIRACLAGQRVAFATATEWVARLSDAKRAGKLGAELRRLGFVPLIVVDEVGYLPFDPETANLIPQIAAQRLVFGRPAPDQPDSVDLGLGAARQDQGRVPITSQRLAARPLRLAYGSAPPASSTLEVVHFSTGVTGPVFDRPRQTLRSTRRASGAPEEGGSRKRPR